MTNGEDPSWNNGDGRTDVRWHHIPARERREAKVPHLDTQHHTIPHHTTPHYAAEITATLRGKDEGERAHLAERNKTQTQAVNGLYTGLSDRRIEKDVILADRVYYTYCTVLQM